VELTHPYGEAVTEVYVHAFQRVAGVKGAEPLVAPAGAKLPCRELKSQKIRGRKKGNKNEEGTKK
jgi:hypothetical protein